MIELALAGWVYFEACGYFVPESGEISSSMKMMRAPNIAGFWIRKESVSGVIDWKTRKGKICSSIYLLGADRSVHVLGTTEETLEKLRE